MEELHQLSAITAKRTAGFTQNTLTPPVKQEATAMPHTVHYTHCPACNSTTIQNAFTARDFSVSKESFPIAECRECGCRFTQDIPCETAIGRYYQSADYVSHSDTKKGLINQLYHIARSYTLKQKVALVQKVSGKKVGMHLDVGSGTGAFVHAMTEEGWLSTGVEPDEQAREIAAKRYKADVFPAEHFFSLPAGTYDAVTLWHVLEHVHRLDEYMTQLKTVISANGKIIIAVPNYTSYDAKTYGAGWAAYDVPRHLYHFSPTAMKKLAERHGLRIKTILPMWLDSFYVSMLSEKYKKGSLLKAVVIGFISNLKTLFNKQRCSSLIYVLEIPK
ncbi:class I SAM-dependent methyltransferase [Lacibacter sp. MH-610]|uniref:class I SAM-dependent methyltransferase n=1 Tax=Lacibacter sp. MH-610 TaxID=3020883 RepID=UPI003891F5DC